MRTSHSDENKLWLRIRSLSLFTLLSLYRRMATLMDFNPRGHTDMQVYICINKKQEKKKKKEGVKTRKTLSFSAKNT